MALTTRQIQTRGRRIVNDLRRCRRDASTRAGRRRCNQRFLTNFNRLEQAIRGSGVTVGARIRSRNQLRNALNRDPAILASLNSARRDR